MQDEPWSPRARADADPSLSSRTRIDLRFPLFAIITMALGGGVLPALVFALAGALEHGEVSLIPHAAGLFLMVAAMMVPLAFAVLVVPAAMIFAALAALLRRSRSTRTSAVAAATLATAATAILAGVVPAMFGVGGPFWIVTVIGGPGSVVVARMVYA